MICATTFYYAFAKFALESCQRGERERRERKCVAAGALIRARNDYSRFQLGKTVELPKAARE
jgi:hypothetical protein